MAELSTVTRNNHKYSMHLFLLKTRPFHVFLNRLTVYKLKDACMYFFGAGFIAYYVCIRKTRICLYLLFVFVFETLGSNSG